MNERPFSGFVPADGPVSLEAILDFPRQFLAYARRFKGSDVEIEIRAKRTKRSDRQNRALHALLSEWGREGGHNIEDLKRDVLEAVFGLREVVSPITGEVKHVLAEPHTSTLDTVKFAHLMERTVELAAGCGVILELPDEWKARKQAEQKQAAKAAQKRSRAA